MSNAAAELDFLGLVEKNPTKMINNPRTSIRGIQSSISRLNPALLRSVMGGANRILTPSFPLLNSASTSVNAKQPEMTAPLTIFYNGTVTVFQVEREVAESIMKVAEAGTRKDGIGMLDKLRGDLPMARKKSLQRFLEKRKERLTAMAPYGSGSENMEAGLEKEKGSMHGVHIGF